jgi:hypothetical protein
VLGQLTTISAALSKRPFVETTFETKAFAFNMQSIGYQSNDNRVERLAKRDDLLDSSHRSVDRRPADPRRCNRLSTDRDFCFNMRLDTIAAPVVCKTP